KAFVGTSHNAILTQLWIALCTYLLLSFARHSARAGWTVQRIMRVLQGNLFEKKSLKELLDPDPPDKKNRASDEALFMTAQTVGQQWDMSGLFLCLSSAHQMPRQ